MTWARDKIYFETSLVNLYGGISATIEKPKISGAIKYNEPGYLDLNELEEETQIREGG
jgi:hypothetical protein